MNPNQQAAADAVAAAAPSGITVALFALLCIVSFICFIKVLIALFKNAGVGLGILGIFCQIFAFVWGWVKSGALNLKTTMIIWTLSTVGIIALQGVIMASFFTNPEMQKLMQDAAKQAQEAQRQQGAPAVPAPAVPATN